jgi:RNA polymerase sigma-32 factor
MNQLLDPNLSADEQLEQEEWLQILQDALPEVRKELNEKEQVILDSRILNEDPLTLQQVADQYGLTRERVRQLETRVIEKLKKHLAGYLDDQN